MRKLFLGLFNLAVVERAGSVQGHSINQWNKKVGVLQVTGMEGPESGVTVLIPQKGLKIRREQRKLSGRLPPV